MNYNEVFNYLNENFSSELLVGFGIMAIIVGFVVLSIILVIFILQGIALKNLADKHNIPNSWLAFIPYANMYILGKLGFEIYAPENKKQEIFTWVLLGLSLATYFLSNSSLIRIVDIGIAVFSSWAYYYIFNKINQKNAVLFTILNAIFEVGGVILFFNRKLFNQEVVNSENKEVTTKNVETKKSEKNDAKSSKYCVYCGNKLNDNSKFCASCGKKVES